MLPFLRFPSRIKKAMNRLHQGAIEYPQRGKRHIEKPMFACFFHQLRHAAAMIDMHNDE